MMDKILVRPLPNVRKSSTELSFYHWKKKKRMKRLSRASNQRKIAYHNTIFLISRKQFVNGLQVDVAVQFAIVQFAPNGAL